MTIEITLTNAPASYGEQVMLNVLVDDGDGGLRVVALGMSSVDARQWSYVLRDVDTRQTPHLDFFFTVMGAGSESRREKSPVAHRLDLGQSCHERVAVYARWTDVADNSLRYYTTAFTECLEPHRRQRPGLKSWRRVLRIVARAPQLRGGERLVMSVGDKAAAPTADRVIAMTEHSVCEWQADINAETVEDTLHFRLAAQDADGGLHWETASERHVAIAQMQAGGMAVHEVEPAQFDVPDRVLRTRRLSMSTLANADNCSMGDFGDLAMCVAQACSEGLDMLCLHPLNDTTSTHTSADATPYFSVSVFALHPLFLDVRQLAAVADPAERSILDGARSELGSRPFDYMRTVELKLRWLHDVFAQEGDRAMHSAAFRHFFAANERWLVPYAQYSYLRDAYATPDFRSWPNHREWTEAERGQLQNSRTKAYKKLAFIYYTQFVLHQQLRRVHDEAVAAGVVLCGDLTANLNPSGCDLWCGQPDVDSDEWWRLRLDIMSQYFDACHVAEKIMRRQEVVLSTHLFVFS